MIRPLKSGAQKKSANETTLRTSLDAYGGRYRNRVCVKLSADPYMRLGRSFLTQERIRYARVPFRANDEVYYFFETAAASMKFLNFLAALEAGDEVLTVGESTVSKVPVSPTRTTVVLA